MNHPTGKAWLRPAFPFPHLDTLVSEAAADAIDSSTNQIYDSHYQSYLAFCHAHQLPIAPSTTNLARYLVYMAKFIRASSIPSYLSGVVFRLRPLYPEITRIRQDDHIRIVLRGLLRQHGSSITRKLPITFKHVDDLFLSYTHPSYDDHLFLMLLSVGFFGLLRLGELTDSNDHRLRNRRKTIRRDSLCFKDNTARFILPASKTDKFFAGNEVIVKHNDHHNDPVTALHTYVSQRDRFFPNLPWLWLTSQGCPPSRSWFLNRFHLHFDKRFGGHSLRAGGATLLAQHNVPFHIIQAIGRWSSEAFLIYIRTHPSLLLPST